VRARRAAAFLALLCVVIAGCGGDDGEATRAATFEVELPEGWTAQGVPERPGGKGDSSAAEGLAVWTADDSGFQTTINVFRAPLQGDSEQQYLRQAGALITQQAKKVIADGAGPTVDGEPSHVVDYLGVTPAVDVRTLIVFRGRDAYNVTLTVLPDDFDARSADFDAIISSWNWTE
jgi:hypothetical protein